jgi:hypothetical protein
MATVNHATVLVDLVNTFEIIESIWLNSCSCGHLHPQESNVVRWPVLFNFNFFGGILELGFVSVCSLLLLLSSM